MKKSLKKVRECGKIYSVIVEGAHGQMSAYTKITENIYRIHTTEEDCAVIFVTGKNNFLINCGSSDKTVEYAIIPALKKMGYGLKSIHGVVFTECSERAAGGAYKLREMASGARFFALDCQADRLKNPAFYEVNAFSICPDHAPPMREIRGIFVDGNVDVTSRMFESLLPLPTPGHGDDSVCWYHTKTKTLICGDNLQGGGSERTGCPMITDFKAYRNSLSEIEELGIKNLVCSEGIFELPPETHGGAQCLDAVTRCLTLEEDCEKFASDYIKSRRAQKLEINFEEMANAYFTEHGVKPAFFGYAIVTFNQYLIYQDMLG